MVECRNYNLTIKTLSIYDRSNSTHARAMAKGIESKKPIRASGTRWIAHKLGAMKRILSQFGVCTVKSADRAKIKGYYKKWTNTKYLLVYAGSEPTSAQSVVHLKMQR